MTENRPLLLLGHTDGATTTSGGLCVLTTHTETPVGTDLLHALKIVTELALHTVGNDLAVLAVLVVLAPVEHPLWDLELLGILDHSDEALDLVGSELAGALVQENVGLLAADVRETTTNTLDGGHCKRDLLLAVHVCGKHTQNVREVRRVEHQSHVHRTSKEPH